MCVATLDLGVGRVVCPHFHCILPHFRLLLIDLCLVTLTQTCALSHWLTMHKCCTSLLAPSEPHLNCIAYSCLAKKVFTSRTCRTVPCRSERWDTELLEVMGRRRGLETLRGTFWHVTQPSPALSLRDSIYVWYNQFLNKCQGNTLELKKYQVATPAQQYP
jgi:hypothetical protein